MKNTNNGGIQSLKIIDNNDDNIIKIKNCICLLYLHTTNIANIIKKEYVSQNPKTIYYYIDYTFRLRYYNNEIKIFNFNDGKVIGLFNLNLFRDGDVYNQYPLYLVFQSNRYPDVYQPWTLSSNVDKVHEYCMTKQDIINKYGIKKDDIPDFNGYLYDKFVHANAVTYNWDNIFQVILNRKFGGNTRKLITTELKRNGISLQSNHLRQGLSKPFKTAFQNAILKDYLYGNYIIPGMYFENNSYQIMYQLLLDVNIQNKSIKFVVVMDKDYEFKRLINVQMGLKNARLIAELPPIWRVK